MKGKLILTILFFILFLPLVCLSDEAVAVPSSTETALSQESSSMSLEELLQRKEELQLELLKLEQMISQSIYSALGKTGELISILSSLQEELSILKQEMEKLKSETGSSIEEFQSSLADLSTRLEALSNQLKNFTDQLEALNQKIAKLESRTKRPQLWDFLILGVALIAIALPFLIPAK